MEETECKDRLKADTHTHTHFKLCNGGTDIVIRVLFLHSELSFVIVQPVKHASLMRGPCGMWLSFDFGIVLTPT